MTQPTMQGILTGLVLAVLPTDTGVNVRLAGITANGKGGVTWIRDVQFSRARLPQPPEVNTFVRVDCLASYVQFETQEKVKASRIEVIGTTCTAIRGTPITRGQAQFMAEAVNRFVFLGNLVRDPQRKTRAPVTEGRVAVTGRTDTHFFNLEAWDQPGLTLAELKRGAPVEVGAILRRDRLPDNGSGPRTADVMEVQSLVLRTLGAGRPASSARPAATTPVRPAAARPSASRPVTGGRPNRPGVAGD